MKVCEMYNYYKWLYLTRDAIKQIKRSIFVLLIAAYITYYVIEYVRFHNQFFTICTFVITILFFVTTIFPCIPAFAVYFSLEYNLSYMSYHLRKNTKQAFLIFQDIDKSSHMYSKNSDIFTIPCIEVRDCRSIDSKYFNILKSAKLRDNIRCDRVLTCDTNIANLTLCTFRGTIDIYIDKNSSIYAKFKLVA